MGLFGWGKKGKVDKAPAEAIPEPEEADEDEGEGEGEDEALARKACAGAAARDPGGRISTAAIITCDRVAPLTRAVDAFLTSQARSERRCELAVFDDSADPGTRDAARAMLRDQAKRHGAEVRYAGRDEKRRYADTLTEHLGAELGAAARALVEGTLFDVHELGRVIGANRNAVLLDTAGVLALSMDDDTICRLTRPPEPEEGLALFSGYDATELWFFADRAAALAAAELEVRDLVALNEPVVGRSLSACVDALGAGSRLDLDRMSDDLMHVLCTGGGRVLVSSVGYAGDSGMASPAYYLTLRGPSYDRLVDDDTYAANRRTRAVIRAPRRTTVSEGVLLMGGAFAFDNRELLPPFSPAPRNSDGVFGVVLRRCQPSGYIAHLPWAIQHEPPETRTFTDADLATPSCRARVAEVLIACVRACELNPKLVSPEARMRALGRGLERIGALSPADFEELVRDAVWRSRSSHVSQLENALDAQDGEPASWARDAERLADSVRKSMSDPDSALASDLGGDRKKDVVLARSMRVVKGYGQLLAAWPEITAAARALRSAGERMSQPA